MKNKNLLAGLFVMSSLVLFTVGIVVIGNRHEAFARHVDFYAEFVNLAGVSPGAKVQVAGMDAGQVLEIGVPNSPAARFRVKVRIDEKLSGLVRTDSVALITTQGVVGDSIVFIRSGSSQASAAQPLATLPSKEPFDLAALMDRGSGLINDVDGTLKQVGGKVSVALDGVTTTVGNVNDVVVDVKQGHGAVGMLLHDERVAEQVRQVVDDSRTVTKNLIQTSEQVNQAVGQVHSIVSDLQTRNLPRQVDDTMAQVHQTMDHVTSASSNLDAMSKQITRTVAEISVPDAQGKTAGENVRESISNANVATANMAEDSEALKRNVLLRGFFRSRGYYNLSQLSPERYRKEKLFTNAANQRTWLAATNLFTTAPDGTETLSSGGKQLLIEALSHNDFALTHPIVVEGYAQLAGNEGWLSRRRAILIRQLLLQHFGLDDGNVGTIGLAATVPPGDSHASWDGVCINVIVPRT